MDRLLPISAARRSGREGGEKRTPVHRLIKQRGCSTDGERCDVMTGKMNIRKRGRRLDGATNCLIQLVYNKRRGNR